MLSLEEIWKKFLEAGLPLNLNYKITNKLSFENLFQVLSLEGTAVRDLDSLVVHVYVRVRVRVRVRVCVCVCVKMWRGMFVCVRVRAHVFGVFFTCVMCVNILKSPL